MIRILFFGKLAEIAESELGKSEFDHSLAEKHHPILLSELRTQLTQNAPLLREELDKSSNLSAVNQVIQHSDFEIVDGDEVAFMSPLSGG